MEFPFPENTLFAWTINPKTTGGARYRVTIVTPHGKVAQSAAICEPN